MYCLYIKELLLYIEEHMSYLEERLLYLNERMLACWHAIEQELQGRVIGANTQPRKYTCQKHASAPVHVCIYMLFEGSCMLCVHIFYNTVADILRVQGLKPDTLRQNNGLAMVSRCAADSCSCKDLGTSHRTYTVYRYRRLPQASVALAGRPARYPFPF